MRIIWKNFKNRGGSQGRTKVREFNKQAIFPKYNIMRNMKTVRDRIITSIPFLSFAITKETTKSRLRLKFVVLMRLKKNETSKFERAKVMIVRGDPKRHLYGI